MMVRNFCFATLGVMLSLIVLPGNFFVLPSAVQTTPEVQPPEPQAPATIGAYYVDIRKPKLIGPFATREFFRDEYGLWRPTTILRSRRG